MSPPARSVPWLAKGFRPFFPLAAAYAVAAIGAWLHAVAARASVAPYFPPPYWHAHEMVHGFSAAVLAGFLLTAASNWTARETLVGARLGALAAAWVAGRAVVAVGHALPAPLVAAVDLAFLPGLLAGVGRPIVGSRSRRNYGLLALLVGLALANGAMHLGALGLLPGGLQRGAAAGVGLVALVVVVVSARVVPMFTRNATGAPVRVTPRADWLAFGGLAALVLADAAGAGPELVGPVAALTALALVLRSWGWGAWASRSVPLLWVLHVGHAFLPLALGLRALAAAGLAPSSAWLHAVGAGAIGTLALGMMTRVGLGHTGRPLVAGRAMTVAFALVIAGAGGRVLAAFAPAAQQATAVVVAGALWSAAFAVYLVACGPALARPRVDGRPG
ncbi:MAG: NnrS family protein [Polyangiaceae bacterium]|nr:NnrS family protein [Polyangiaceae bacterium]